MLIDTHCHINIIIKKKFNVPITIQQIEQAQEIVKEAYDAGVQHIINVGTSVIESQNCIILAQECRNNYAVVGLHPNDCTPTWQDDLKKITPLVANRYENKIVAIGECGLDYHYPNHNRQRQKDAFRAQIELALEHKLPLVIHTRDAGDETLECLQEYKNDSISGVFHCFSQDMSFAEYAVKELGFLIGIGGPITYPNNNRLRDIVMHVTLDSVILETDAPYLPPQNIRGKRNHPKQIRAIAQYLAHFLNERLEIVAKITTHNAFELFKLEEFQQ